MSDIWFYQNVAIMSHAAVGILIHTSFCLFVQMFPKVLGVRLLWHRAQPGFQLLVSITEQAVLLKRGNLRCATSPAVNTYINFLTT